MFDNPTVWQDHEIANCPRSLLKNPTEIFLRGRCFLAPSCSFSIPGASSTLSIPSQRRLTRDEYHRGLLKSFGAYQAYYTTAFLSHKSSSAISWIGTIQAFLLDVVGIAIGPIFDRGQLYPLVYSGSFLIVFGMLMLSLCSAYWQVILAQGVCAGIGMGFNFVPSIAVVTASFEKKRAIAVGIAASASF